MEHVFDIKLKRLEPWIISFETIMHLKGSTDEKKKKRHYGEKVVGII